MIRLLKTKKKKTVVNNYITRTAYSDEHTQLDRSITDPAAKQK